MSLAITRASYLEGSNFVPCFLGSKHALPARKSKAQRNKDSPNGWCILSREFKGTTNVGGNVEKGICSWNMVAIRSRINTPTRVFLKGKLGNFETSWKGCNETTDISNKRIMEETFARLTRRLTTRPRIKLLPSVYFHDERRRIERFFRSDRSRNFLIWVERLETGQEVRRNTSWFRPIWTNPPDRYESFVITSNFPFRFGRGRSPCGFESSS